jgi:hypothetical protein
MYIRSVVYHTHLVVNWLGNLPRAVLSSRSFWRGANWVDILGCIYTRSSRNEAGVITLFGNVVVDIEDLEWRCESRGSWRGTDYLRWVGALISLSVFGRKVRSETDEHFGHGV